MLDFINKIKLPKIAKNHPIAFWVAVVLHFVLLFGLIFAGVQRWQAPTPKTPKAAKYVPKAITVDLSEIKKEKQRLVDLKKQKKLKLQSEKKRLKLLEDQRYKTQKRVNQLKVQTKAAKKKQKIADKKAKAAEEKKKIADKKAKAAEEKQKIADKKAKAAQKQKDKIEKQRALEAKKFKTEQDQRALKNEIQDEEAEERKIAQDDMLSKLKTSYTKRVAARVREKWSYRGAKDDWNCEVYILQDLSGNVQSVDVKSCNIDDSAKAQAFKDSIERAVYKASPLPNAPDKNVFDREILFYFLVN